MALPEGDQALFPEDALCSLQDAVILRAWVFGGELLDLKLEENTEKVCSNSTAHFNKFKCPLWEFTALRAKQCPPMDSHLEMTGMWFM